MATLYYNYCCTLLFTPVCAHTEYYCSSSCSYSSCLIHSKIINVCTLLQLHYSIHQFVIVYQLYVFFRTTKPLSLPSPGELFEQLAWRVPGECFNAPQGLAWRVPGECFNAPQGLAWRVPGECFSAPQGNSYVNP